MTTAAFNSLASAHARAISEVRSKHCQPPAYRPAAAVSGTTRCPKCRGLLTYRVSAVDGRTSGHCSSAHCLRWSE